MYAIYVDWLMFPDGGVWSNILASFVWSGLVWLPAMLRLHRKVDRQHAALTQQAAELHEDATRQRQEHHDALIAHITATATTDVEPGEWR